MCVTKHYLFSLMTMLKFLNVKLFEFLHVKSIPLIEN